jgi:phosphate starvation-inducible PhoH-like protein
LKAELHSVDVFMTPTDNRRLANLCGQFDENLKLIEQRLGVEINTRGNLFQIIGSKASVETAQEILLKLYQETGNQQAITSDHIHLMLREARVETTTNIPATTKTLKTIELQSSRGVVKPRSPNQIEYVHNLLSYNMNFGIGPAGTGKTYLAVACAVDALLHGRVSRIILARPAVEAGERLGFLPGDLSQKIDPYLRPLYDALWEMLGVEQVAKYIERNIIEVAPLAYMRGRTLNDAFIILDESQNTTVEQMKMFLTRLGFNSTAVINGDITQVDLPRGKLSGLKHVTEVLKGVPDISFTHFSSADVVRHPLVQKVVDAYARYEKAHNQERRDEY